MKKYLAFPFAILVSLIAVAQTSATSTVKIALNNAYLKSDGTYAVVVKDMPGTQLALYVNDKNPVHATVNRKDWATFRGVKLTSTSKVSFTKAYKSHGKTYQKPINYVRYTTAKNGAVAFTASNPTKQTSSTSAQASAKPASAPVASTPAPTPQPTCTNGTYVNTAGNTVCRPEATPTVPAGATAECRDGTYSFSQTHSGTCSHHGGVSQWL